MEESWAKEKISPETYAKTVAKTSKSFRVAWDTTFSSPLLLFGKEVAGSEVEDILNKSFVMGSTVVCASDSLILGPKARMPSW